MSRICVRHFVLLAAGLAAIISAHAQPLAIFYMTDETDSVRDFLAHSSRIGLLVPTWYQVDQNGLVTGAPNALVLKRAHAEKLPVMPIVALADQEGFHLLANSAAAQAHMNEAMVRECKLRGYAGFQFDFENIASADRDALSALVKASADALHRAGLKLSIATVPNAPGHPSDSKLSQWSYAQWGGAYDLAAIGKAADLVCLMTYDQHTDWTPPGPVAGWPWFVENLEYTLQSVPKEKLALGIPLYGHHWFAAAPELNEATGEYEPSEGTEDVSARDALLLARRYHGRIEWDAGDRSPYFYFNHDQQREWVYFTDLRAFRERYDLAVKEGVAGFCSWVLGQEDPAIWTVLPRLH